MGRTLIALVTSLLIAGCHRDVKDGSQASRVIRLGDSERDARSVLDGAELKKAQMAILSPEGEVADDVYELPSERVLIVGFSVEGRVSQLTVIEHVDQPRSMRNTLELAEVNLDAWKRKGEG